MKIILLFGVFLSGVLAQQPPAPSSMGTTPEILADLAGRPAMRLEEFEQLALGNNPTLRQAAALIQQSAGEARQSSLYPNPSIGYQGEQIRGGSYGGGEQGAFLQQTFVLGGKRGLRRNVYEQQRRSDEISLTEQRHRVLSDVGQSFIATLAAQEVVKMRKQLLKLATDAVVTAHQLANVGQADAPDVLQAEVEADQASVDYTASQRAYLQSFLNLAALAGQPNMPLSRVTGDLEHPPEVDSDQIIDHIIRDSPSVKRAEQEVARAESQVKSQRREVVPDLQIRGGVEQNSERINEFARSPVGLQAFASASVNLPLFNRNQGNIAAANASLERARSEVKRVQLSLRLTAQPLLQGFLSTQVQAARYKNEMIPRAMRAYQLYLQKYSQMGAAYPQVLVSQRTLFELQVGYIGALQTLWMHAIALQNYGLSAGLDAPSSSREQISPLNLPGSAGAAAAQ